MTPSVGPPYRQDRQQILSWKAARVAPTTTRRTPQQKMILHGDLLGDQCGEKG